MKRIAAVRPVHLQPSHDIHLLHGLLLSVAMGALHVALSADEASGDVDLTQGVPTPPLMPSQMMTPDPPHGDLIFQSTKRMFSQTAFGLVLHVSRAVLRPYLPDVVPVKF